MGSTETAPGDTKKKHKIYEKLSCQVNGDGGWGRALAWSWLLVNDSRMQGSGNGVSFYDLDLVSLWSEKLGKGKGQSNNPRVIRIR